MNLADVYPWFVFAHILGAFIFAAAHGISVGVALRMNRERDLATLSTLLTLSGTSIAVLYVGLLLLLIGGIGAGILGGHFARLWIWLSLGLLLAIAAAMYALGTTYFTRLRAAIGAPTRDTDATAPTASREEIDALIARNPAAILAAIGGIGFVLILWLMVFKPF